MAFPHERILDRQRHQALGKHLRIHLFRLTCLCQRHGGQNHPAINANCRQSAVGADGAGVSSPADIRELIEKTYRIIYRIKQDQIDVPAVIHGAQLMPEDL